MTLLIILRFLQFLAFGMDPTTGLRTAEETKDE